MGTSLEFIREYFYIIPTLSTKIKPFSEIDQKKIDYIASPIDNSKFENMWMHNIGLSN